MAQPQAYNREVDFTERDGDDTNHAGINAEMDAAALSINQIRDNLALIQKDDGGLQNGIVTAESLAPSAFDAVKGQLNESVNDAQQAAASATLAATTSIGARDAANASAIAAAQSSTNAATSAAGAATAAQTIFNGLYLGAQATDPTTDLNGQPLNSGDFYYNSAAKLFRAYDASLPGFTNATPSGQFKRPKFVAGTDFTPGTTTTLTLESDPITSKNMFVFFDGIAQHNDQFSTAGMTLTFTSPIPLGVSAVEVAYLEALGLNVPADGSVSTGKLANGSVTNDKVAADANIASSKLALTAELAMETGATLVGSDDGESGSLWTTVAGFIAHTQEKIVTVKDYGAVGNGVADDTASIQAMLTDLGYFTLIDGTFKITDTLYVPTAKNLGAIISGNGMEKSTINCVGMVGKPAITGAAAGFYRVSIRDLGIIGDADNAIGFTAAHAFYNASFDNLVLRSGAGSCFLMPEHFSCSWRNVHVQSIGGHGFDIEGGNSTVLINCYAHNFTVGNGKAGYRIRGNAVLIACNGVDSGDVWGIFGDSTAIGGSESTFQIRMIGCNIEDFQSYALGIMFTGNLQLIGNTFIAKPSGTFETLIKGSSPVAAGWRLFDRGNIYASKGSTRSGQSNVITGTPAHLDVGSGIFTDYYNSTVSLLYPLANPSTSGPAYQTLAHKFPNLDADRFFGFVVQTHGNWTANASTFSVAGLNLVRTANTAATNLDNATGATINGHRLTIMVNDANTTIRHSIGGAGRFINSSGANIVATSGKVYEYVHHNSIWWQVGG